MSQIDFRALEPQLRTRAVFPHVTEDRVRFSDTDMMGHVNNTAFAAYCETGRVSFNRWLFPNYTGDQVMVARIAINYLAEMQFPNVVTIGTGVAHIGNSSYTLAQGLFVAEQCVATAEGVLVHIDRQTRRSAPWPEAMRSVLTKAMLTL